MNRRATATSRARAGALLYCSLLAVRAAADSSGMDLAAEAEIAALITTYAWAIDGKNIDDMLSIFAPDAVYDLSAYGHPGVVGRDAIREFFATVVFRQEQCSFSSISNVRVQVTGERATGADYFIHFGYREARDGAATRKHVEGQHFYEFVKASGRWQISSMRGRPTFEQVESIDPAGIRHCGHGPRARPADSDKP